MQTQDIEQGLTETVSLLDKLRMAIYHGEFTPGHRLVESELSQKYETSRGAVREALALLQYEGLIIRQRNRSAWVRPVTLSEAIEITEVRAVIEGLCTAKAAARATEADHRELRRMAEEMTNAVKRGDVLNDSRISDEIHAKIRAIAGQETAAEHPRPPQVPGRALPVPRVAAARPPRPGAPGAPGHRRRGDRG